MEWKKWNTLKKGYIQSQLIWNYRNKVIPPPNFSKDHYKGIGVIPTEEELRYKNPVNYTVKKTLQQNNLEKSNKKTKQKSKPKTNKRDNFKKKKSL